MIEPIMTKLSIDVLDTVLADEIIYAEVAGSGAMGNSGGITIYLIKAGQLVCYETSLFSDENTYLGAERLLFKHQNTYKHNDIKTDKILFDFYYGGMGNSVFVNKNVSLKIGDGYFIYNRNNIEYQIFSSVHGVFDSVVYAMKGSENNLN
ncbi:hypothetical protein [uncultured Lutibacter sp.]|uniref:hypothetical protein n=1 Tax=uncultured Lutibacter sp. TaxID=437739 RepID=UPI00260F60F5|nr:hypothetical protein [uncultured Lutibacter sp.]